MSGNLSSFGAEGCGTSPECEIERGSVEEAFSSLAGSTQLERSRASALSNVTIDSDQRGAGLTLQAVPVPPRSGAAQRQSPVVRKRPPVRPRLALLASDLVALTLCLSAALYLVHQPTSASVDSALLANIVLSLPLLIVVVIALATQQPLLEGARPGAQELVHRVARHRLRPRDRRLRRARHRPPLRVLRAPGDTGTGHDRGRVASRSRRAFRLGAPSVVRCCVPSRPSSAECS